MTTRTTRPALILLSPDDNVFVACRTLDVGENVEADGAHFALSTRIPLGHKVARTAIPAGESAIKYGAPIGIATRDIAAGEHVHIHNLRSDYLPTYTLDGANPYVKVAP